MQKLMIMIALVFFFFTGGGNFTKSQAQVIVKIKPMGGRVLKNRPVARKGKVWIPAHWKYSYKQRRYVWKAGHWAKARRGYRYVEGHWKKVAGGHKYVPGHWKRL